ISDSTGSIRIRQVAELESGAGVVGVEASMKLVAAGLDHKTDGETRRRNFRALADLDDLEFLHRVIVVVHRHVVGFLCGHNPINHDRILSAGPVGTNSLLLMDAAPAHL